MAAKTTTKKRGIYFEQDNRNSSTSIINRLLNHDTSTLLNVN